MSVLPLVSFFVSAKGREQYLARYHEARRLGPEPVETRDIPTRFGIVRVYRHGPTNGSPIVLIHAFLVTSAAWAANVSALAEHHPVYTLDALGQAGASVQTVRIRSAADQVAWLGECFDALGLDRVHLVGWSYGGWMSLHHALLASDRTATLTLVEPANTLARMPVVGFYRRTFALPVVTRLHGAYFDSLSDRYLAWLLPGPDQSNPVLVRYRGILELLRAACSAYVPGGVPVPRYIDDEVLRSLQVPVLALLAGRSNVHNSAACARRLAALVPGAEVHTWPTAGHALPMEFADEVNARILEFLGKHG